MHTMKGNQSIFNIIKLSVNHKVNKLIAESSDVINYRSQSNNDHLVSLGGGAPTGVGRRLIILSNDTQCSSRCAVW